MKRNRLSSTCFTAALAVLLLVGCEHPFAVPRVLVGDWVALETSGEHRIGDWLELRADGRYRWTTATFGPGGTPQDEMITWMELIDGWRVDDGNLSLRTVSGLAWAGGQTSQLDFVPQWRTGHRLALRGDTLILEEIRVSERVAAPRIIRFTRAPEAAEPPVPFP